MVTSLVSSQSVRPRADLSRTLREALSLSGFDDAILSAGGPDLDRTLTSWDCDYTSDVFAAGYYFADELDGQSLGPLHLSRFRRVDRSWAHAVISAGDRDGGSVVGVQISGAYILVEMHASPSAGYTLVTAADDLHTVAPVYGFSPHLMPNGTVRFIGSMVHFAPTHQEKLFLMNPQLKATEEVFPGPRDSDQAEGYRRTIRMVYAQLSEESRRKLDDPLNDFDRGLEAISELADGSRLGFVARYSCDRCDVLVPGAVAPLFTAVQCTRHGPSWSCNERELQQAAMDLGLRLDRNRYGSYSQQALDAVVRAMLNRP